MIKLYNSDCLEVLKTLEDNSIDLTVTSPPYDSIRLYNNSNFVWTNNQWEPIIDALYRCTKPHGTVVWIVSDQCINGSKSGSSFKQALYAKEIGFNLHDVMIWNKMNFTSVGDLRTRYAQVFEYMFIFTKGKPFVFNPIKDRKNKSFGEVYHQTLRQKDGSVKRRYGFGQKKYKSMDNAIIYGR